MASGVKTVMHAPKFQSGGTVEFLPSDLRLTPLGRFEILRALPIERGVAQYRIKSLEDGHQRVAMECDLT